MGKARSNPRRIVTRMLVFLLLGAVVNVAVAWGLAYWLPIPAQGWKVQTIADSNLPGDREWTVVFNDRIGAARVAANAYEKSSGEDVSIIPSWSVLNELMERVAAEARAGAAAAPKSVPTDFPVFVQDEARGRPMLSLHWQRDFGLTTAAPTQRPILNGIELPSRTISIDAIPHSDARALPLRPIWPGFAIINTIFYAALLWLLWAAPGAIRRMRRKQRGLCITCGYDQRGAPADSANCPECGAGHSKRAGSG